MAAPVEHLFRGSSWKCGESEGGEKLAGDESATSDIFHTNSKITPFVTANSHTRREHCRTDLADLYNCSHQLPCTVCIHTYMCVCMGQYWASKSAIL